MDTPKNRKYLLKTAHPAEAEAKAAWVRAELTVDAAKVAAAKAWKVWKSESRKSTRGPYKSKGANAAFFRGRAARAGRVNVCDNPEVSFQPAWSYGWDRENAEIKKADAATGGGA